MTTETPSAVVLRVTSRYIQKQYKLASDTIEGVITKATDKSVYFEGTGLVSPADYCRRCGLAIEHPISKLLGFGPICCENIGLPRPDLEQDEIDELRRRMAALLQWSGWLPRRWLDVVDGALPPAPELPPPVKIISAADGLFAVRSPYDPDQVAAVKAIKGRRYHGEDPEDKHWTIPAEQFEAVERLAEAFDITVDESAQALLQQTRAEVERQQQAEQQERAELLAASRADDAELVVEGLGGDLRPFQRAGVAYALRTQRCFIADEMGLGKTVQALATIEALGAYPALIVCPASLKLNWQREAAKWLPGRTIQVLDGKSATFQADVLIINYDLLADGWVKDGKGRATKEVRLSAQAHGVAARGLRAIAYDESHYCKNHTAQRTKACEVLSRDVPLRLALTGTPVVNRPHELLSQLSILDRLEDFGGFWAFAKRYCEAKQKSIGKKKAVWDFSGAAHLDELNEKLRASCYIRRTKADVLKELPAKQRALLPLALNNRREYDRAERELIAWLRARAADDTAFLASIADLPLDEQAQLRIERANSAEERARRAEQLVRIEALKQLAARGKLDGVTEWVESFLESGEKLIIFAHHTEIVDLLAEAFDAPSITGQTPLEQRQAAVDRFQNDPSCRVIVLNIRAGGVGLTLTAASNVAFVELDWTPAAHDQAEDRAHRIGQEQTVTAWYLLADATIDTEIMQLIETKRAVVTAATDGIIADQTVSVLNALVDRLIAE